MRKINFNLLAIGFVIALIFAVGCSKEEYLERDTTSQMVKKGPIDWLKGLFKKKVKIYFGHNEPNAECVYKGLCFIEIEFGVGGHGATGYLDNDTLYVAFFKEDLSIDDINYHFEDNEFEVVDGIYFPDEGIDNSSSDYYIEDGVYEVYEEDDDFIMVQF